MADLLNRRPRTALESRRQRTVLLVWPQADGHNRPHDAGFLGRGPPRAVRGADPRWLYQRRPSLADFAGRQGSPVVDLSLERLDSDSGRRQLAYAAREPTAAPMTARCRRTVEPPDLLHWE